MLLPTIGSRLRARRAERGLTQSELAVRAGVSARFLVQLEKGEGNISVQRLHDVCGVLDLPLEALFRGLGPDRREKLALVGLRGAGKSTVGAALAARLGVPLIEVDGLVVDAAGMALGEIFENRGQEGYREVEARCVARVLDQPGPAIIATGGSLVTAPDTWSRLRQVARTAWLQASPASHLQRVLAQGDLRPMRGRPDAQGELKEILAARAALYAQADVALDTDVLGVEGVVDRLASW
jgi:XRE family transcriptional regulator, aerobic/anaerobic benzoate catabolism transcriptional regulator